MIAANVPQNQWYMFYPEAFLHATHMDGLEMVKLNEETKTQYKHFGFEIPKFVKYLQTWGKATTVTTKMRGQWAKLPNCGTKMMFVGYATDSSGNTYCMWNPNTNRMIKTWDVVWLGQMYFPPLLAKHRGPTKPYTKRLW